MSVGRTTFPFVRVLLCVAASTFTAIDLHAQEPSPPRGGAGKPWSPLDGFRGFETLLSGFSWDDEAQRLRQAATGLWKRNGWNDEADLFARDVACEVTAIPPWDMPTRMQLMMQRIAERYDLNPDQAAQLRESIIREDGAFFRKHGPMVMEFGTEALLTRAKGQPYTPQQVQKWAANLEPLFADVRQTVGRLGKELEPSLNPQAKQKLEADLGSIDKRAKYVDEMRVHWANGEWQPSDWGLEKDPIQTRTAPRSADVPAPIPPPPPPPAPTTPVEPTATLVPIPSHWLPHDPPTWIAYLLHVERRFALDAGQKMTAESIHAELLDRATDYSKSHRPELDPVPAADRPTHSAYEPIRAMFAELQQRLEALPTTSQRQSAKP